MTGQGDRSAILDRDAKHLGLRADGQGNLVADRAGPDRARRAALRRGELLCRIDLGARIDAATLSKQGIVRILDVVTS